MEIIIDENRIIRLDKNQQPEMVWIDTGASKTMDWKDWFELAYLFQNIIGDLQQRVAALENRP